MTAAQPFSSEMKETLPNYSNMEETNKNRDKSALNFIIRRKTKITSQSYPVDDPESTWYSDESEGIADGRDK